MFGRTPARANSGGPPTGLTARDVGALRRRQIRLPGTVDSSPIFLRAVRAGGRRRDVYVMTTTYGRTLAVDAHSGRIVWTFTPSGYRSWAGTAQITNATPVADSDRAHVFAASPDGRIHRLSVRSGLEDPGGGRWPVTLTRDPTHEKLTSSLGLSGGRVLASTGGYIGDAPPYQGHVVTIDHRSGRILGVFNSLCSDRHGIIAPGRCPASDSAIWGRAGVVVEPDGRLLATSSNGPYDGRTNWADTVLELSPTAGRLLRHWTPPNHQQLEDTDLDLGSTSPVLVPGGILQSGKQGRLYVLSARTFRPVQTLENPGGQGMFTAPAVLRQGRRTTVFATTAGSTVAYRWSGHRLHGLWSNGTAGTSPVVAGGLLYVYDPTGGGLVVYRPRTGRVVARLPAGRGHWNSPVIAAGTIALPEGDANDHATTGVLDLYRLR
jgi:outer membrane protein assembly factor BamB